MADKSGRLLIVSQWFWPEAIGSPLYMSDLARYLADKFAVVDVLTGRPFYPGDYIFPGYESGERDRETSFGLNLFRQPTYVTKGGGAKARLLNEGLFLARATLALILSRPKRADLVVSLCPSILAVVVGVLATRRGGRHLAVVHDIQSGLAGELGMLKSDRILRVLRGLERIVLNRVSAVVVLSEKMKERLQEQGVQVPIEVLPIWVDTEALRPLPKPAGSPPTAMYSGNLGRKQGIEQVLAMAEGLKRKRPDARVLIRGSGAQAERVREEIATKRLDTVALEGLVPSERLNESLAEADVHLVPQNPSAADYAVPSKVYSIMAAARPFVCTALRGSTLWMLMEASGACVCVPPDDPDAFATAVAGLLDDPDRARSMGERGRVFVEAHASRDKVLAGYLALLQSAQPGPAAVAAPGRI